MAEPQVAIEPRADARDVNFVRTQLDSHNLAITGFDDFRPLNIFARDERGVIIGGLTGFTWGGTLKVDILWVREDWRGRGYGARLLTTAEAEGRVRGCQRAVLETHSFQAPGFYQKLGYALCGTAEGYPTGHQHHMLQKPL